jgi:hypothetical protein
VTAVAEYAEAIETNRALPSIFANLIRDRDGKIKRGWEYRGNLRTTVGIDWQAAAMGKGPTVVRTSAATASSATTLTDSGSTRTLNQDAGYIIVAAVSATSVTQGIIVSNTSTAGTVWTVVSWSNGTPSATGGYIILGQPAGMAYLAVTSDAVAPGAGDTTLASEATTNGFSRVAGTYAHTGGTNTFTISNTFTASGTLTVNKEAMFNSGYVASPSGTMGFESAEPNPPTLVSGDTLAQTVTVTF